MEVRAFLRVVRRRWTLILGCVIAAVCAGSFVVAKTTPLYVSTAQLFVSTSDTVQAYQGSLFSEERVASYAELAADPALADRVTTREQLKMDPAEFSKRIKARVIPDTVILQISVSATDPVQARRLSRVTAYELSKYISELETPPDKASAPIKATLLSASLPATPASPKPVRDLALASLLGLLVGMAAALSREMLDTSVTTADDVAEAVAVPVMGNISEDPNAAAGSLLTSLDPHSARYEAFRVLRTNLQFVDVDKDSRVFVVTSALPGEGKTTIAANLAISFAQSGQKVLLLEGDLHEAAMADFLGLEHGVGLTTVLVGESSFEDAIQSGPEPKLAVLTSGAIPPNPAELLQTAAMREVLQRARENFNVVIIDAPPLLTVTDAALLAAESDGALIVTRHGRTTKEQLRHALQRLDIVDARAVGVVLNRVPRSGQASYGYGERYRGRYGGSYLDEADSQRRR